MKTRTSFLLSVITLGILVLFGVASGLAPVEPVESFQLGTFLIGGEPALGLVLQDRYVVELKGANKDLQRNVGYVQVPMAKDMKEMAGRYHLGLNQRVYEIVNHVVREGLLESDPRPWYVHEVSSVRKLPPINPNKILNAAGNYYGHVGESLPPEEQAKIAEERRRNRGIPYLFLKPTSAIIPDGHPIVIPKDRTKIDWECELAAIIGQPARYVTVDQAKDHIFGYTIEIDVSDRGGRGEEESRSDWLVGKGQDTFAPLGPYITPAEFIEDPMNLHQTLTVNGEVMQDANSSNMIHNIYELIEYGSQRLTLEAGDIVSAGSPQGTGMSLTVREEQIFLKPGDKVVATIEGIGTLTHEVKAYESVAGAAPTTSSR